MSNTTFTAIDLSCSAKAFSDSLTSVWIWTGRQNQQSELSLEPSMNDPENNAVLRLPSSPYHLHPDLLVPTLTELCPRLRRERRRTWAHNPGLWLPVKAAPVQVLPHSDHLWPPPRPRKVHPAECLRAHFGVPAQIPTTFL